MSSSAPSPSLRSLFSELEQLFQSETEARVSTSVQAAERALAEHLNQAVRRLRQSTEFAAIASVLCDASVPFAESCAVFQVNDNAVTGTRLRGSSDETAERFTALQFDVKEAPAFAAVVQSREPLVAVHSPGEISPAASEFLPSSAGDRIHLFPVTNAQSAAGVLCAAGKVESAALELLVQVASAVLEITHPPVAIPEALVRIEAAPNLPVAPTAPAWDELPEADRHLHLRAQRFARVQVAEMRLYHSDAVKAGRAQADLYSALRETIDAARDTYRQSFAGAAPTMVDYLHRELLHTLANENPALLGGEYPGPLV